MRCSASPCRFLVQVALAGAFVGGWLFCVRSPLPGAAPGTPRELSPGVIGDALPDGAVVDLHAIYLPSSKVKREEEYCVTLLRNLANPIVRKIHLYSTLDLP